VAKLGNWHGSYHGDATYHMGYHVSPNPGHVNYHVRTMLITMSVSNLLYGLSAEFPTQGGSRGGFWRFDGPSGFAVGFSGGWRFVVPKGVWWRALVIG